MAVLTMHRNTVHSPALNILQNDVSLTNAFENIKYTARARIRHTFKLLLVHSELIRGDFKIINFIN